MKSFPVKTLVVLVTVFASMYSSSVYSQVSKPTASSSFRTVRIVTQPGASIWIDGVLYGKADTTGTILIKTVAAGAHSLRVRLDGYKEQTQALTAVQRGDVSVTLAKTTDEAELSFQLAERLSASDREKSADAYRKAIKLRPNYPDAYIGLARVLAETGDLDEAKAAIVTARRLRAGFAEASAVEGRILKDNGDEAKAIAAFKRAITEGKNFQPEAYAGLGLLYKEKAEGIGGTGDFDEETANYTEAGKNLRSAIKQLSGAPDALIIYQLLGLIYERQKKYAEAISLYEEFLRIFPNSVEATAVRSFIVQIKKDMASQ